MPPIKIAKPINWGLSTHLFVYQPLSENVLDSIIDMGLRQIELWAMRPHFDYTNPQTVSNLKTWLARRNMTVYAVHAPFYAHVEELKQGRELSLCSDDPAVREETMRHILMAAELLPVLGARVLILHTGGLKDQFSEHRLELIGEHITELLARTESSGIRLALENTPTSLSAMPNLLRLVQRINSPRLGICLDIGHANVGGSPLEALAQCSSHLFAIHASDNNGLADQHLIPGQGNIPWADVLERLHQSGHTCPLSLELRKSAAEDWEAIISSVKAGIAAGFSLR